MILIREKKKKESQHELYYVSIHRLSLIFLLYKKESFRIKSKNNKLRKFYYESIRHTLI